MTINRRIRRVRLVLLGAVLAGAMHGATCGHRVWAQSHPDTVEVRVPAGTWYFALRAFNASGLYSGYSNEVRITCTPAYAETTCGARFWWDRNPESDLTGYLLSWGPGSGAGEYNSSQVVPVDLAGGGQRLTAPQLRIRR